MFPTQLNNEGKLFHDGRVASVDKTTALAEKPRSAGQTITFFAYKSWCSNLSINMEVSSEAC
jgi:hypothetical protein